MDSILVTGGAGNIGSALVRGLIKQPQTQVVVADNLSTGSLDKVRIDAGNLTVVKVEVKDAGVPAHGTTLVRDTVAAAVATSHPPKGPAAAGSTACILRADSVGESEQRRAMPIPPRPVSVPPLPWKV